MKVLVAPLRMPGPYMKAQRALDEIVQQRWPLVETDCFRTEMRRCQIGEHVLISPDADAVVMLDHDHRHPADTVYRLRKDAEDHPEADVIGALCFRRAAPYDPCAWWYNKETGKYWANIPWPKGLVEYDAIGMGAVLFRRKCFEVLPKPWFAYDYSNVAEDIWPTEDIWFSKAARAAGLRIFVDTTLISPHIFEGEIDENTCLSYAAAHPQEAVKED